MKKLSLLMIFLFFFVNSGWGQDFYYNGGNQWVIGWAPWLDINNNTLSEHPHLPSHNAIFNRNAISLEINVELNLNSFIIESGFNIILFLIPALNPDTAVFSKNLYIDGSLGGWGDTRRKFNIENLIIGPNGLTSTGMWDITMFGATVTIDADKVTINPVTSSTGNIDAGDKDVVITVPPGTGNIDLGDINSSGDINIDIDDPNKLVPFPNITGGGNLIINGVPHIPPLSDKNLVIGRGDLSAFSASAYDIINLDSNPTLDPVYTVGNNANIYFVNAGTFSDSATLNAPSGYIEIRGNYSPTGTLALNPGSSGLRLNNAVISLGALSFSSGSSHITLLGTANSITAYNITINNGISSHGTASNLTLNAAAAVSVTGAAGTNTNPLGDITIAGNITLNDSVNISAGGDIVFAGPASLTNVNISAVNKNINFNDVVTLNGNNTVNSDTGTGNILFNHPVPTASALTGTGNINISAGAGTVSFLRILGTSASARTGNIIVNNASNVTFSGNVYAGTINISSSANININANMNTDGSQTYNGNAVLGNNITFAAGAAANTVTFNGKINSSSASAPRQVIINPSEVQFNGDVGDNDDITSIEVYGAAVINADITTVGNQNYGGTVNLGAVTRVLTSTGGSITAAGVVSGTAGVTMYSSQGITMDALNTLNTAAANSEVTLFNNRGTPAGNIIFRKNTAAALRINITNINGNITIPQAGDIIINSLQASGNITLGSNPQTTGAVTTLPAGAAISANTLTVSAAGGVSLTHDNNVQTVSITNITSGNVNYVSSRVNNLTITASNTPAAGSVIINEKNGDLIIGTSGVSAGNNINFIASNGDVIIPSGVAVTAGSNSNTHGTSASIYINANEFNVLGSSGNISPGSPSGWICVCDVDDLNISNARIAGDRICLYHKHLVFGIGFDETQFTPPDNYRIIKYGETSFSETIFRVANNRNIYLIDIDSTVNSYEFNISSGSTGFIEIRDTYAPDPAKPITLIPGGGGIRLNNANINMGTAAFNTNSPAVQLILVGTADSSITASAVNLNAVTGGNNDLTITAGTINLYANITTGGNQSYNGNVILNANTVITGAVNGLIKFEGGINGAAHTLTINNADVEFNGVVGNISGLSTGTSAANAGTAVIKADISAVNQNYYGPVVLGNNITLTTANFHNTLNSSTGANHNLTITGNAVFAGIVGTSDSSGNRLGTLSVSGTTGLGTSIFTAGNQTYSSSVTINASSILTTDSNVLFSSSVVSSGANITVNANNITINAANNTSAGSQTYNGNVILGAAGLTFTGSAVSFGKNNDTVTGNGALTVNGAAVFNGSVGNVTVLTVSGTSSINADITTTGNQVYAGIHFGGTNPVGLSAGGSVNASGVVSGTDIDVTINAVGGIGMINSGNAQDGILKLYNTVSGQINISAGNIELTAVNKIAGGVINVHKSGILRIALIDTNTSLDLSSPTGSVNLGAGGSELAGELILVGELITENLTINSSDTIDMLDKNYIINLTISGAGGNVEFQNSGNLRILGISNIANNSSVKILAMVDDYDVNGMTAGDINVIGNITTTGEIILISGLVRNIIIEDTSIISGSRLSLITAGWEEPGLDCGTVNIEGDIYLTLVNGDHVHDDEAALYIWAGTLEGTGSIELYNTGILCANLSDEFALGPDQEPEPGDFDFVFNVKEFHIHTRNSRDIVYRSGRRTQGDQNDFYDLTTFMYINAELISLPDEIGNSETGNVYIIGINNVNGPQNSRSIEVITGANGYIKFIGEYSSSGTLTLKPGSGGIRLDDANINSGNVFGIANSNNQILLTGRPTSSGTSKINAGVISLGPVTASVDGVYSLELTTAADSINISGNIGTSGARLDIISFNSANEINISGSDVYANGIIAATPVSFNTINLYIDKAEFNDVMIRRGGTVTLKSGHVIQNNGSTLLLQEGSGSLNGAVLDITSGIWQMGVIPLSDPQAELNSFTGVNGIFSPLGTDNIITRASQSSRLITNKFNLTDSNAFSVNNSGWVFITIKGLDDAVNIGTAQEFTHDSAKRDFPRLILEMAGNGAQNISAMQPIGSLHVIEGSKTNLTNIINNELEIFGEVQIQYSSALPLAPSGNFGVLDAGENNISMIAALNESKNLNGTAGNVKTGRWNIINGPDIIVRDASDFAQEMHAFKQDQDKIVYFKKNDPADTNVFFEIIGNTVWRTFKCEDQSGVTIQFSTHPDQHVFLHAFLLSSDDENNKITVTRYIDPLNAARNSWIFIYNMQDITNASFGIPMVPAPNNLKAESESEKEKFWNFNFLPSDVEMDQLDFQNVIMYFSHAWYQTITLVDTMSLEAVPYYEPGENSYFNYNWIKEVLRRIIYSFAEDGNGNGIVDRIRVQTPTTLNGNFDGFEVMVIDYITRGYNLVGNVTATTDDNDSFYILLEEKPFFYDGQPIKWQIIENTTLRDTVRSVSVGGNDGTIYTTINTIPPRINYALTLPGHNETFVHVSQPVASYNGSAGLIHGNRITSHDHLESALETSPLPDYKDILMYPAGGLQYELNAEEALRTGAQNYLITLSGSADAAALADLPQIGDAASPAEYFELQGLWSLAVRALDWSDLAVDENSSYPPPKYPVDWSYSGYAYYRGNSHINSLTADDDSYYPVNEPSFVPPYQLLTSDMLKKIEAYGVEFAANGGTHGFSSANKVTPDMFQNGGDRFMRRSTDILVSQPPADGSSENYFVWPVWARFANQLNPDAYQSGGGFWGQTITDTGIIWEFDGTKYLEEYGAFEKRGDIELQVRSLMPSNNLELFWSSNIPAEFRADGLLGERGKSTGGFWLPNMFILNNREPLYYFSPVYTGNEINIEDNPQKVHPLYVFKFDAASLSSGNKIEFMFRRKNAPDMFIARLDIPRGSDIPKNWYELIRPFGFDIQDIRRQRGGVTILNNVINSDNREVTYLRYHLVRPGRVTIQVYTLDGTLVKSLRRNEYREAGEWTEGWDGTNNGGRPVARGMYFIRVAAPDIDEIRKVMVVK